MWYICTYHHIMEHFFKGWIHLMGICAVFFLNRATNNNKNYMFNFLHVFKKVHSVINQVTGQGEPSYPVQHPGIPVDSSSIR